MREHIERVGVVFYEKKNQNMKAGWEIKTLGDVCDFQRGLTYTKSDEVEISNNVVLRATNVNLATNLLDFTELKYISDNVIVPESKKIKTGSLIICTASGSKSHLGKVAYIDEDYGYAFGGFMGMITPKQNLNSSFLFHLMTSGAYKDFIAAVSDGANINNLKFDDLKKFTVPLPPLPEQKRLVTLLDEAFESIATAKANAEQNLKNARALFESHLNEVFTKRGEGWEVKPLSHFASTVSTGPFGSLLHKSDYVSEGVPLVNPINIVNGKIIPNEDKLIDESTKQRLQNYVLQEGDVILGRRGEIGRCAVVNVEQAGWICGTGCFFIRPLATITPDFLAGLIRSSGYREQLENASTGATMLNLSNKAISDLSIAVPTLAEQQNLLKKLDLISEETQRLKALYSRKIAALDELKKALLHRAFSGEL